VKGLVCAEDDSSVFGASEVSKHAVSCLYMALISGCVRCRERT
jgi:hypothetical protein